ncbi:hypothetical protein [Flavobacterium sp.]|uniref:hypothetical protein n=1 Tax=Flavobacterium sp. TaxID=239 RepID=UPI00374FF632
MTNNLHLDIWEAYSASWSEQNKKIRKEILNKILVSDCNYTDPNIDVVGINNLLNYMSEFQNGFPGARFVVTDFKVHHDQSLAHWNMVDGNGTILSKGASFGIYKNAQLTKMTGFFWEV